jgi:photosystem II stability/assembly factor-like uncharacterized protein
MTRFTTTLTTLFSSVVVMTISATDAAHAQYEWILQAPLPYPALSNPQLAFFGDQRGFMVGWPDDDSLSTIDGGESWSLAFPGAEYDTILALDEQNGWVFGGGGGARTTDGGQTWQPVVSPNNAYEVRFLTPSFGWVSDNYAVAITHNAGAIWEHALLGGSQITYPDFIDENVGVGIEDDDETLWRTVDGGATWTNVLQRAFNNFDEFHTVRFLDADTVIATGYSTIFRSTDAGQTWTEVLTDPDLYLTGRITVFDEQTVLIDHFSVGFLSTDAGATWQEIDFPYSVGDVGHVSGSEIWAGNIHGELLYSPDYGQSWERRFDGPDLGLTDVAFRTPDHAIAAGAHMIMESFDGGDTWQLTSSGSEYAVTDIEMSDSGLGFSTGHSSVVCRTTDDGEQWVLDRDLNFVHANTVEIVNDDVIFVGGQQGFPKRSTDGGLTWEVLGAHEGLAVVRDFSFLDAQLGYAACGYSGTGWMLKTSDGGDSWTTLEGPVPGGFRAVHFFNDNTGVALHSETLVIRTTDGGATWTQHTIPSFSSIAMSFADESVGWTVGDFGSVARTTNGGITWTAQDPGTDDHLRSVCAVSETEAWAGGAYNTLLHTTDSGETWQSVEVDGLEAINRIITINAIEVRPSDGDMWIGGDEGLIFHRPGDYAPPPDADLDANGLVDVTDLLILLANWGPCPDPEDCDGDIDGNESVDVSDLLLLLANWG